MPHAASSPAPVTVAAAEGKGAGAVSLPRLAWLPVGAVALAKVGFQLATANLYGAHRDVYYYLASGRHLAWGYVDNPPLTPALYRASDALFGHSLLALTIVPALFGGVYVLLGAFLAREFGGRRFAQLLAATVGAVGPLYLTTSHFLGTVSPDLVLWAIASWLVVRMIRRDDPRLWIAIGAVCGIGLLNKHTMLFWIAAAGFGLLTSGQRHLFASRWLALGVAISLVIWAPNLVWEARHHWATLEFFRHLRENNGGEDVAQFVPLQFGIVTIAGTVVVFVALRALARDHALRSARFLLDGYVFAFVVLFALQGKAYYLGSWYLPLIGLGAAVVETRWTRRSARVLLAAVLVTGLSAAPIFTPILPEATAVRLGFDDLNGDLGAMLGWPHFVRRIAGVYRALPASERRDAVVLTGNYGEAGAIDYYGRSLGLPHPISGHNTYWWWGYGDPRPDAVVIAVGVWPGALTPYFRSVTKITDFASDSVPIDPHERDTVVFVCRGLRVSWPTFWAHQRQYD